MSVREMWKAKLEGKPLPARSSAGGAGFVLSRPPFGGCVLGIDPSLRGTGLALIDFVPGRAPVLLHCRTVKIE